MLTRNDRQEALTRAYVRVIAAQAGTIVGEPEVDYGLDLFIRPVTLRDGRRRDVGPQLDLQLKSTTRAAVGDTHLACDLDAVYYNDLREPSEFSPRILVVLVLPSDEAQWVAQ